MVDLTMRAEDIVSLPICLFKNEHAHKNPPRPYSNSFGKSLGSLICAQKEKELINGQIKIINANKHKN